MSVAPDPTACCATPSPAPRRVVVAADSSTVGHSSALRSTDLTAARDGQGSGDTL